MSVLYSKHAKEMLKLRGIAQKLVEQCLSNPDYILSSEKSRKIYIKDFGVNFLKVIIVEENGNKIIITAHWLAKNRFKP